MVSEKRSQVLLRFEDIAALSYEEAETWIAVLQDQETRIDMQLETARGERRATGEYRDARWYASAMIALKIRRKLIQKLHAHVKTWKRAHGLSIDAAFLTAARTKLSNDLFQELLDDARTIKENSITTLER